MIEKIKNIYSKFLMILNPLEQPITEMRKNPTIFFVEKLLLEFKSITIPILPDDRTQKKISRLSRIIDYLMEKEGYKSNVEKFITDLFNTVCYKPDSDIKNKMCEYCVYGYLNGRVSLYCELKNKYYIKYNYNSGVFKLKTEYGDVLKMERNEKNNCKFFVRVNK